MVNTQKTVVEFDLKNPFVPKDAYLAGLLEAVNDLAVHLSIEERRALCFEKLRLEDADVDEQAYIQAAVELTVCAHYSKFFPQDFIYEEKVNPPKDVDCTLRVGEYKYNVEVKCANFTKKQCIDDGGGFKIGSLGRLDDFDELVSGLEVLFAEGGHTLSRQRHMDNNLKDFLISAHEKFSPCSAEKELNVLMVACDDAMDMQKWHSYMYGVRGLFTVDSYVNPEEFSRVDLVVITNLYHRHKSPESKNKLVSHWRLSEAFCILCENPASLKPEETFLEFSKTVRHYNNELQAHTMEGDAPDFILKGLVIPDYVVNVLQKEGAYYFQPGSDING